MPKPAKPDRRKFFIDAARALLDEGAKVTIADIAKRAGWSLGEFYNHFKSDRELYAAMFAEDVAGYEKGLDDAGCLAILARYVTPELRAVLEAEGFVPGAEERAA